MSTFKWSAYNTADTAVAGSLMNALATGAYTQPGTAINNTVGLYLYGDLSITLSSAVSVPSGGLPTISVWLLPSLDGGTTYPLPPGNAAAAPPANLLVGTMAMVPGVSTSSMVLRGIVLPPSFFKILIQNNLGVAFPSTSTSTCSLYRYYEQAV